jgi:hypothetical protein
LIWGKGKIGYLLEWIDVNLAKSPLSLQSAQGKKWWARIWKARRNGWPFIPFYDTYGHPAVRRLIRGRCVKIPIVL